MTKPPVEQAELDRAVELHQQWLRDPAQGKRLSFSGRDLRGCAFDKLVLVSAELIECELDGVSFAEQPSSRLGLSCSARRREFAEAMGGAQFTDCSVAGADFTGARAPDATFLRCKLTGASFRGAHLYKASFLSCDLSEADFAEAMTERTLRQ